MVPINFLAEPVVPTPTTFISLQSFSNSFKTFLTAGVATILIGDYGMYAFSKISGGSAVPTMGYYFTSGIMQDTTQVRYPYFAALGIILSILTAIIVFSVRGLLNRVDPFEDMDGRKKKGKRRKGAVLTCGKSR